MNNQNHYLPIIFLIFCGSLFAPMISAQSGSIGELKIIKGYKNGIKISAYNVKVTGMKDQEVHFGFMLYQNDQWFEESWQPINPQIVNYDPAFWNDEAFWCTYSYSYLKKLGNESDPFVCSFMIIATKNNQVIEQNEIEFSIQKTDVKNQQQEVKRMPEKYDEIIIQYSAALGDEFRIEKKTLYYSYIIGEEYDSPVSANVRTQYATKDIQLNDNEMKSIIDLFYNSGWTALKEAYGVSETERHYPEKIRFKDQNNDKTVIYRSGQTKGTKRPKEFTLIYQALKALADKYFPVNKR